MFYCWLCPQLSFCVGAPLCYLLQVIQWLRKGTSYNPTSNHFQAPIIRTEQGLQGIHNHEQSPQLHRGFGEHKLNVFTLKTQLSIASRQNSVFTTSTLLMWRTFCLLCEIRDWFTAKIMFLTSFVWKQKSIRPSKHSIVLIVQCLQCGTPHFNSLESNKSLERSQWQICYSAAWLNHWGAAWPDHWEYSDSGNILQV